MLETNNAKAGKVPVSGRAGTAPPAKQDATTTDAGKRGQETRDAPPADIPAPASGKKKPPSPNDFYGVIKTARDAAKAQGKNSDNAAKLAANLAGELTLLGAEEGEKQKALNDFYKNPTEKGRESAVNVGIAEVFGLPLDKVNKGYKDATGREPSPKELLDLIGATKLLGDTEAGERT
jgi:hypothetical protein